MKVRHSTSVMAGQIKLSKDSSLSDVLYLTIYTEEKTFSITFQIRVGIRCIIRRAIIIYALKFRTVYQLFILGNVIYGRLLTEMLEFYYAQLPSWPNKELNT